MVKKKKIIIIIINNIIIIIIIIIIITLVRKPVLTGVSTRCFFGQQIYWFLVDEWPIRVKKVRFQKYQD